MLDRSISMQLLWTEALRVLRQSLLLVAVLAVLCIALHFWLRSPKLLAIIFASFFALVFISAPMASSSLRSKRGLRLLTRAGGRTLVFCFLWGSAATAGAIATLQLWQGMEATALDYLLAMLSAGSACAVFASFPIRG